MNTETKLKIKNDLYQFVQKVKSQNKASQQLVGVSIGTISNILADKWDNISDDMWTKIQNQVSISVESEWKVLTETKRMNMIQTVYLDAQQYSEVFCVVAPEGSGKTEPSKRFAERENVYLVKCKEHLNRKTFLGDLLHAMGKDSGGYTVYEMMGVVLETILRADKPLIILDEADKISDQVLYFFITIYNETEGKCGLVLQATDHLKKRIQKGVSINKKGYKEIFSRIGRKFIELPANTTDELKRIAIINGVDDELEAVRIVNDSEMDIRRIKRLVLAYRRKKGAA
ncbi:ATP-binding protein [Sphingobacterium cavernae]|uniref:ATP-binding protein n=1 Tax=Sphingobacterium cavernae TaxID=2592657 RepID=UPI00122FCECB|nr:ATP-binding protein [Sphingobacterium cavernae]